MPFFRRELPTIHESGEGQTHVFSTHLRQQEDKAAARSLRALTKSTQKVQAIKKYPQVQCFINSDITGHVFLFWTEFQEIYNHGFLFATVVNCTTVAS